MLPKMKEELNFLLIELAEQAKRLNVRFQEFEDSKIA
jgi:hypothetical protein